MDEPFLYLTTIGRTTGAPRQIEIWFVEYAGRHYIVAERGVESGWVKNLLRNPRVRFSVGTRGAPASALPLTEGIARLPSESGEPELLAAVRSRMQHQYQWSDGLVVELAPSS